MSVTNQNIIAHVISFLFLILLNFIISRFDKSSEDNGYGYNNSKRAKLETNRLPDKINPNCTSNHTFSHVSNSNSNVSNSNHEDPYLKVYKLLNL